MDANRWRRWLCLYKRYRRKPLLAWATLLISEIGSKDLKNLVIFKPRMLYLSPLYRLKLLLLTDTKIFI